MAVQIKNLRDLNMPIIGNFHSQLFGNIFPAIQYHTVQISHVLTIKSYHYNTE